MNELPVGGVDVARQVFRLHGAEVEGAAVGREKLSIAGLVSGGLAASCPAS